MRKLFKSFATIAFLLMLFVVMAANWFVHQPRYWQEAKRTPWPGWLAPWILEVGHRSAEFTDDMQITGSDNTLPYSVLLDTNAILCAGAPVCTNAVRQKEIKMLKRAGFIIGYSSRLRHPVWVAYKAHPYKPGVLPPRPSGFKPDPEAPRSPKHNEYTRSGYDRGHMAPNEAIATRYGADAQRQTFLTSNICPQRPSLNQGPWRDMELRISDIWPQRFNTIWVIVGAVTPPDETRTLESGVNIPVGFYQIIVAQKEGRIYSCAVYMPQNLRRRALPRINLVSIDELEELTGLDFLAELPDAVEDEIEARTATRLLPAGPLGYFKILRERHRKYGSTRGSR